MEYKIACGQASATVNTLGGELTGFAREGIEYVWLGDPAYWTGHAPVLFPTVGSLKNRETEIEGKTYQMKKHGFARKSEFELVSVTGDSATFLLKASPETKASYPYDFELFVTHQVFDTGFKTTFKVVNPDNRDILFGIGGHTGFNCPLFAGSAFSDYTVQFEQAESGPFYYTRTDDCDGVIHREDAVPELAGTTSLPLDYSLFDRDVLLMDNLKSTTIKLINVKNNRGLAFTMQGFSSIGFWTPPLKQAPFICLEPWTVNPDFSDASGKFDEKPGVTRLAPQGVSTVSYEMRIL